MGLLNLLKRWWLECVMILGSVVYLVWIASLSVPHCIDAPAFYLQDTIYDCKVVSAPASVSVPR
jgi:hypothetical protein